MPAWISLISYQSSAREVMSGQAANKKGENSMRRSTDVLIVGGGIIGCSIAYFLRKRGVEVTALEKGEIGDQASGAAAGLLAPIRPLAQQDPFKALQLAGL